MTEFFLFIFIYMRISSFTRSTLFYIYEPSFLLKNELKYILLLIWCTIYSKCWIFIALPMCELLISKYSTWKHNSIVSLKSEFVGWLPFKDNEHKWRRDYGNLISCVYIYMYIAIRDPLNCNSAVVKSVLIWWFIHENNAIHWNESNISRIKTKLYELFMYASNFKNERWIEVHIL